MKPMDRWGPFADGLEPGERVARLRGLRAIAHLLLGWRGYGLKDCLNRAESDPSVLEDCLTAIDALASLDRRRVLATYAVISRSGRSDLASAAHNVQQALGAET